MSLTERDNFPLIEILVNKTESQLMFSVHLMQLFCAEYNDQNIYHPNFRTDIRLIKLVKLLGRDASGFGCDIKIEKAYENYWVISKYDGHETVFFQPRFNEDSQELLRLDLPDAELGRRIRWLNARDKKYESLHYQISD